MRTAAVILILAFAARAQECLVVASDRILARDLAELDPIFAALDAELAVGFTPMPGARRVLTGHDLALIASKNGLLFAPQHPFPNACVERRAEPISAERMKQALVEALAVPGAKLELLDFSRQALPAGTLEFPRGGLGAPPPGHPDVPVLWRGRLRYDGARSMAVWARIKALVEVSSLVAVEDLPAGKPIRREQVRRVSSEQFPFGPESPTEEAATGRIPRRSILAGSTIAVAALDEPEQIVRGETVLVNVIGGGARLSFEAQALASGRRGSFIAIRNPAGGATFRGKVEDKGKVIVNLEERP
jgi:flagella basal body P-ring formation protein FlgA